MDCSEEDLHKPRISRHDIITLHYIRRLYSGLNKSNFKDHYDDVVITQCLGKIAEINKFSASDEMLSVTRQTGRQQVDCSNWQLADDQFHYK